VVKEVGSIEEGQGYGYRVQNVENEVSFLQFRVG
jgi:hypothetical protein